MSKEKGGAIAPLFSLGPVQDKSTLVYTLHSVDFAVYFRVLSKSVPRIKAQSGQKNTPVIKMVQMGDSHLGQ